MALIKCPECNKEISSSAKLCPHCGCDFFSMLKNRFQIQFITCDQSQKNIYSFEKYPQDGNVGILIPKFPKWLYRELYVTPRKTA